MSGKKHYICNNPIRHDGDTYAVGDEIELTDPEAEQLLAVAAVAAVAAKKQASQSASNNVTPIKPAVDDEESPAPADPADRIQAIRAAIEALDKNNAKLWLKDGTTPDVKALEDVLGYGITAAERNEAVAE